MKILKVTLWLYGTAFRRSWECLLKNWVVSFAPLAYSVGLTLVGFFVGPLGIVGGLLIGLATQACVSSGLYLIEKMVQGGGADFDDFLRGFTVYIWELIRISFILWIPMRIVAMVLAPVPNGGLIYFLIEIALYVLLNPVPEFIYQTTSSGLELLSASYDFIVENWIEWFVPNIAITLVGYFLLNLLSMAVIGLPALLQFFAIVFGLGLCLTYVMVFRGFLFAELNGTTRRARSYRYDAQS